MYEHESSSFRSPHRTETIQVLRTGEGGYERNIGPRITFYWCFSTYFADWHSLSGSFAVPKRSYKIFLTVVLSVLSNIDYNKYTAVAII